MGKHKILINFPLSCLLCGCFELFIWVMNSSYLKCQEIQVSSLTFSALPNHLFSHLTQVTLCSTERNTVKIHPSQVTACPCGHSEQHQCYKVGCFSFSVYKIWLLGRIYSALWHPLAPKPAWGQSHGWPNRTEVQDFQFSKHYRRGKQTTKTFEMLVTILFPYRIC